MINRKIIALLVVTLLFLYMLVGVQPAAAEDKVVCETSKEIEAKVPVLMVHGLNGRPELWDSMTAVVKGVSNIRSVTPFDYSEDANKWVTDTNIGLKLAKHIDCLAQASRNGGGKGEVIVVAHSMGGLATRYASGQTINGHRVSDELGLVIMIGTPSLGSRGGNACQITTWAKQNMGWCEGDAPEAMAVLGDKLKALPKFPANVAVKTIAGNVGVRTTFLFGLIAVPTMSDLLVPVQSALAGSKRGPGGGAETVSCDGITVIHGFSGASCEHGKLPSNPKVQVAVKSSIQAYLKSLESKVKLTGKLVLNGLQIPTSSKWEVRGIADYPEGTRGAVYDMTTCKRTSEGDYWKVCAQFFVHLDGDEWLNIIKDSCSGFKLVEKGAKVGNLAASIYRVTECPESDMTTPAFLWHIPGKGSITVEPSSQGREMEGMREAFAAAVWK